MAPKVPKDTTFIGWLEDFTKLPGNVAAETVAVVKNKNNEYLGLKTISRAPATGVTNAQFMAALIEGEASSNDIKGVNTSVDVLKLIKDPIKTVQALGTQTVNDIFNVEEFGTDRRRDIFTNLMNGKAIEDVGHLPVSDQEKELNKADKWILNTKIAKSLGPFSAAPFDPRTGKSTIQLLVKNTAPNSHSIDMEDRRTVEEDEWTKRGTLPKGEQEDKFKTYKDLSTAAASLAGGMERVEPRIANRDNVLKAYNRTVARELGIDLNKALCTDKTELLKKSFTKTLIEDYDGDIEALIADGETGLVKAFGLSGKQLELVKNPKIRLYVEELARTEEVNALMLHYKIFNQSGAALAEDVRKAKMSTRIWQKEYRKAAKARGFIGKKIASAEDHVNSALFKSTLLNEVSKRSIDAMLISDVVYEDIREMIMKNAKDSDAAMRALDRLESASHVKDLANGLFFAGTTKDFLSAVQDGSTMKQLLVTSKLLGAIPWLKVRSTADYVSFLNVNNIFGEDNVVAKTTRLIISGENDIGNKKGKAWVKNNIGLDKIPQYLGLTAGYEGTMPKFAPVKFKKRIGIHWQEKPSETARFAFVRATQAKGLIGDGVDIYTVLNELENISHWNTYNAKTLLSNKGQLDSFMNQLRLAGEQLSTGTIIPGTTTEFLDFAKGLNFDKLDVFEKFKKNYTEFNTNGGWKFLEDMHTKLGVAENDRWRFLNSIFKKQGLAAEFAKKYAGILDMWNAAANQARTFIFKNIVFNESLTSISILKLGQNLIRKIGVSDEVRLLEAIGKWKFIQAIKDIGESFKTLSTLGTSSLVYEQRMAILKLQTTRPGRFLLKLIASKLGRKLATGTILKALGYAISSIAGFFTGGISWVITVFGSAIWKAGKGLVVGIFKRDWGTIKQGFKDAGYEILGIVNVVKKLIIYPIACCLSLGCGCAFFMIIILASFIAPLVGLSGGEAETETSHEDTTVTQTNKIEVTKTAELTLDTDDQTGPGYIDYTITITNTSEDPVTITRVNDELYYESSCTDDAAPVIVLYRNNLTEQENQAAGFIGAKTSIISYTYPRTLNADESIVESYKIDLVGSDLQEINDDLEATYANTVTVEIEEDDLPGMASTTTDLRGGGCQLCPSGWPTTGYITQGPGGGTLGDGTTWSHSTMDGPGGEAVDIALSTQNNPVYASVEGTVTTGWEENGFGNYVKITNSQIEDIVYAHLVSRDVATGDHVMKGDRIGIMGNTGNSRGTHLHYDFNGGGASPFQQCLGRDLKLEADNGFIPQTIIRNCTNADGSTNRCNTGLKITSY